MVSKIKGLEGEKMLKKIPWEMMTSWRLFWERFADRFSGPMIDDVDVISASLKL